MDIIEATVGYIPSIIKSQKKAYQKVRDFNPSAIVDTSVDLERRINANDWKVFIGVNENDEVMAGISYLINSTKDAVYGCRFFSVGNNGEGFELLEDISIRMSSNGIQTVYARVFEGDSLLSKYQQKGFKIASIAEIDECRALIGDKIPSTEKRVYIVKHM